MSGLEIYKILGALFFAGVAALVTSIIADTLVQPGKKMPATVSIAAKVPAAPKKEEKAVPIAIRLATADAAAGKKISSKCKSCHNMTTKMKIGIGPPLWDIVQTSKAANGKFKYSAAMNGMGGKWSYEDLDAFIASPQGFMKGTKMTFAGIKNAKYRANLIAFLRSLSDAPKPLPK